MISEHLVITKGTRYRPEYRWPKLLNYKCIIIVYMGHKFYRKMCTFSSQKDVSKVNTWMLTEKFPCCLSLWYFISDVWVAPEIRYGWVFTLYSTWWHSLSGFLCNDPIHHVSKLKIIDISNWPTFYWNNSGR